MTENFGLPNQFVFIPYFSTLVMVFSSNSNFENADQVLKYVILRRPTSKLLFRTQQPADEESHVSKGSVCFFAVFNSKLIFSADSYRRFFGRRGSIPLLEKYFLFHHQATVVTVSRSLRMSGL
jgi:hypothetical protein